MGKQTNISWAISTLNLVMGCTKVSSECLLCYIYRLMPIWGKDPYKLHFLNLDAAIKRVKTYGEIIFVNSFSDWLHKDIPDGEIDRWFDRIFTKFDKQFLLLTKRADRLTDYFSNRYCPDNVWLGVSCGIKGGKKRIDILREIDCKIHFVSFEPLLEDLGELHLENIQWAIIGGESDHKEPRPMQKEWVDNIIKQCREQGVAIWFKQWGGIGGDGAGGDVYEGKQIHEYPNYKEQTFKLVEH